MTSLIAASALSCHLLADHRFSLHIADQHWWKLCYPVFYLWSAFASNTLCNISIAMDFSDAWHLLLSKLGFSTNLHLHCLHLTRVCGLCHHPPLSNSGNVSGHHLAGSNKTGCWSSFVSFVASFSSVQSCHPCHLSSYSRWLCPWIWTWNSTMLSSPSPGPASCGLIDHRTFFTDSMMIIAFITINSGLVPLIEGLYAQIYFEIWDYWWFAFTSFAFLFRKEKYA